MTATTNVATKPEVGTEAAVGCIVHRATRRLRSLIPGMDIIETTIRYEHPGSPLRDGFVRIRRRVRRRVRPLDGPATD